jgi:hypothetical protein
MNRILLAGFLMLWMLAPSCGPGENTDLMVSNPLGISRIDASLHLSRELILEHMEIPENLLPFLVEEDGTPVPCQVDDLDEDGQWDEIFALINLGPSETKQLNINVCLPGEYPTFKKRTNVRLGAISLPDFPDLKKAERLEGVSFHNYAGKTGAAFQMEGPAWESDLVGFRNYLDQRNGMDIFGKLSREMVLDSVGLPGKPSYHAPADWGMDVLKVGTSLGAGAIAFMVDDSLYRVGDNGSGIYDFIFEGSQRSLFVLSYKNWTAGDSNLQVEHQIEIVGGSRCYASQVTYTGTNNKVLLVPGMVNIKSEEFHVAAVNDQFTALYTHSAQAENKTLMAMALLVPSDRIDSHGKTRDQGEGITQTQSREYPYPIVFTHSGKRRIRAGPPGSRCSPT